jgi:hypothetical protein
MSDQPEFDADRSFAIRHLNQVQLARRWCLSPRTLEAWRWRGIGPNYLKLNGRVAYRVEDVVEWESEQLRAPGSESEPRTLFTKADGGAA